MSSAFDDAQYREAYPDGYADHYWHVARDRIVLEAMRWAVPAGATCLEIGCGRGHFVTALRAASFDAWGVELGHPPVLPDAVPFVRTGISFADLPGAIRNSVACVLLLDVIEHLTEPGSFLREVVASFPALATVVVTVPARPEIWSNYDEHYGHLRRYTIGGLEGELASSGLRAVEARYTFHVLYLAALGLRLLRAERGIVQQAPSNRGLHRLIGRTLALESRLLPKRLHGSSLIAIATPERQE